MGIIAVANDTEDCSLNPCLKLNGGCQDRCNVADNGTILCSCFLGKELAADLRTCEPAKPKENVTCESDEFKCNKTGKCILKVHICDLEFDCGPDDFSDESPFQNCTKAECKPVTEFRCNNGQCILSKWVGIGIQLLDL